MRQGTHALRDVRAAEGVIACHRNLRTVPARLIGTGIDSKALEDGMLNAGLGKDHRDGFAMHRSARRDRTAVVLKQRLEAKADTEDGNGAKGGTDKLHHAACITWMPGPGGKNNYVGLCVEHVLCRNGIAKYGGIEVC